MQIDPVEFRITSEGFRQQRNGHDAGKQLCQNGCLWCAPGESRSMCVEVRGARAWSRNTVMLYAIISEDVKNSLERRLAARPDHLARLEKLRDEGRLVLAGPHPAVDSSTPGEAGFTGSLVVAEFDSLEAAQAWADADPYVIADVYAAVTVKPFNKVLP